MLCIVIYCHPLHLTCMYCWYILRSRQNYPDLKDNLTELRKYLIESSDDTAPLQVWELQGIQHLY